MTTIVMGWIWTSKTGAPGGGDGNGDGKTDAMQANVASLPAVDGNYVTLELLDPASGGLLAGARLVDVRVEQWQGIPSLLGGADSEIGKFSYAIEGISALGQAVDVRMTVHSGQEPSVYYKFGSTPASPFSHWYEFDVQTDPQQNRTVAEFDGNQITLHFVDGLRGDGDITAEGTIVDPGGPGFVGNTPPIIQTDSCRSDRRWRVARHADLHIQRS